MADFTPIIQEINTNLPDNSTQSITAEKLRTTLIDLTNTIDNEQDAFESQIDNYLTSVIGGTIVEHHTGNWTGGYGEYTTLVATNVGNLPFILKKKFDYDVNIDKIYINIATTGTLKIRYVTDTVYSTIASTGTALANVSFTTLGNITVTSTGAQSFDVNYSLPAGCHLAIGDSAQAVTWNWASTDAYADYGGIFFSSGGNHISTISGRPYCVGFDYSYDTITSYGDGILRQTMKSVLKDKTFSILGDSISTYSGYIPSGNATFYPTAGNDVTNVNDTWWMKTISAFGGSLKLNNSWSGSKVTGTDSSSATSRASNLGSNPDIIFVWMGINDFNQEVSLGTWNGSTPLPTTKTTFREAYAITLNTIMTTYPTAKVYCFTLPDIERNNPSTEPPEINEAGVSLKQWNDAIKEVADAMCVEVIDLSKCGIHWHNLSTYTSDSVHPNKAGHSIIANYLIHNLDNAIWKRY